MPSVHRGQQEFSNFPLGFEPGRNPASFRRERSWSSLYCCTHQGISVPEFCFKMQCGFGTGEELSSRECEFASLEEKRSVLLPPCFPAMEGYQGTSILLAGSGDPNWRRRQAANFWEYGKGQDEKERADCPESRTEDRSPGLPTLIPPLSPLHPCLA